MTHRHPAFAPNFIGAPDAISSGDGAAYSTIDTGIVLPPSSVKTISTYIYKPVTLGHHYGGHITITDTGRITPTAYGATAMYDPASRPAAYILNMGSIIGGPSGDIQFAIAGDGLVVDGANARINNMGRISGGYNDGSTGGVGVSLIGANARLTNSGTIYGSPAPSGSIGLYVASNNAIIDNSGQIFGGGGTEDYSNDRGIGVDLRAAASLTNHGVISVGGPFFGGASSFGGTGVVLGAAGDSFSNFGLVSSGLIAGYDYTGYGVSFGNGDRVFNAGTITATGDVGSAAILQLGGTLINQGVVHGYGYCTDGVRAYAGTINNQGTIIGGETGYFYDGGRGGNGIFAFGAINLTNSGTIRGGGGVYKYGRSYLGGDGVDLSGGGTLRNTGEILGGGHDIGPAYSYGSQPGLGAGVTFGKGGTLINAGTIQGGSGFGDPNSSDNGAGACGVVFLSNGTIQNTGTILGGDAFVGALYRQGYTGGTGVDITTAASITNLGTIIGGYGAIATNHAIGSDGDGGIGVDLNGGLLINAGLISGGAAAPDALQGDAIYFGTQAGTLVVEQGARFSGDIVARPTVNDVLVLGNTTSGTFSGLGATVTGFSTLRENTGTTWTLTGSPGISAASQVIAGDLNIIGTLVDSGNVTNTGTITATAGALSFLGTLTNNGVLTTGAATVTGSLAIGGTGIINVSAGGTIDLLHGAAAGQTIDVLATSSLVELYNPLSFLGTISGFAPHGHIEINQPGGLPETSYNFANGTLAIMNGSTLEAALHLAGNFTTSDFSLRADGYGGIVITYV